ncbi:MAG TPA: hypothetical protein VH539_10385 [Gemmatimonadaceae bacterium]
MPKLDFDELDDDVRAKVAARLGITAPRNGPRRSANMSKDQVRSHALRVLAVVASLSQRERKRVLQHALKVNDV